MQQCKALARENQQQPSGLAAMMLMSCSLHYVEAAAAAHSSGST
jgi:hypothetical protein